MQLKPPVFVIGCPRSGTTWLHHLLLSAGGFAIYRVEVMACTYLAPLVNGFTDQQRTKKFLDTLLRSEYFLRSGLDAEMFRSRMFEECHATGDFQRILMESICEQQGASRWADCTPDNSLHIREISASFPDARFIHVIRDGRDVALSLAAQGWIRPFPWTAKESLLPAAAYWDWFVERSRAIGRGIGAGYLEVHYRDLVRKPEETLSEISDFLSHNLDYDRIMRAAIGSVQEPNTSFTNSGSGGFDPIDRWKRTLVKAELRAVESFVGRQLEELGYETVHPPNELNVGVLGATNRLLYRCRFGTREWLKHHTMLGVYFGDTSLLEHASRGDEDDRTLRPGANLEYIRSLVSSA